MCRVSSCVSLGLVFAGPPSALVIDQFYRSIHTYRSVNRWYLPYKKWLALECTWKLSQTIRETPLLFVWASNQNTFNQCWVDVAPVSWTLSQHYTAIGSLSRVCWVFYPEYTYTSGDYNAPSKHGKWKKRLNDSRYHYNNTTGLNFGTLHSGHADDFNKLSWKKNQLSTFFSRVWLNDLGLYCGVLYLIDCGIKYRIISYHIISYRVVSFCMISYGIVSYHITLCNMIPYYQISIS